MAKRASLSAGLNKVASIKPAASGTVSPPALSQKSEKLRGYNYRMTDESLVVLKQAALDNRTTIRDIFTGALNAWAKERGIKHSFS